ncbi:MAG: 50S ribosomal protein L6 [Candidatus Pacebacteria bacterium]|nr:50S ribosomal protein L6 [Candidatus Paceibacterota bacterium]
MSRIGKKPIIIPENTELKQDGATITVKGLKGELTRTFRSEVAVKVDGNTINLEPANNSKFARSLWGTYGSHLQNMIDGVNKPFEKKLIITGVGYRAEITGNKITLTLGYSHKIEVEVPTSLTVTIEKNKITIVGVDKEEVGQFAAKIRSYRTPEPYKGKGIRYDDEIIKRKEGKKTV